MGEKCFTTAFTIDANELRNGLSKSGDDIASSYEIIGNMVANHGIYEFIPTYRYPKVKKVIYNFKNSEKPTTIVFWDDDTKTVVKCDKETFNKESGLAQCYIKKILGSRGNIQKLIENADIQQ